MHTEVNYNGIHNLRMKEAAALSDIRSFVPVQQRRVLRDAAVGGCTREMFVFLCMLAGVQGYPVSVLYNSYLN